jgi:hypothetical protein
VIPDSGLREFFDHLYENGQIDCTKCSAGLVSCHGRDAPATLASDRLDNMQYRARAGRYENTTLVSGGPKIN